MLQHGTFPTTIGCSWSSAQYSAPRRGLTVARPRASISRTRGHAEARTKQASTFHKGASTQQLVAPRSTGPFGWLRHKLCAPPAALPPADASDSSAVKAGPANSTASDSTRLRQCLRLEFDQAARQAAMEGRQAVSADTAADIQRWVEYLGKFQETENDYWHYVLCGDWKEHPDGWTGPARALLQIWEVPGSPEKYDYLTWQLDASGLPTGKAYHSGSALEKLTTKKSYRGFNDSFHILTEPGTAAECSPDLTPRQQIRHLQKIAVQRTTNLFDQQLPFMRLTTWLRHNLGIDKLESSTYTGSGTVFDPQQQVAPSVGLIKSSTERRKETKRRAARKAKLGDRSLPKYTSESVMAAIAAAAVTSGRSPVYKYPGPPLLQSTELHMAENDIHRHNNLLRDIKAGEVDLSKTHIPVTDLFPGFMTVSAAPPPAAGEQHEDDTPNQVYRIEELQQRADAVVVAQQQGLAVDNSVRPVVPDSSRPFTLTMTNAKDGQQYVVAHYEPEALKEEQALMSAQLCTIFHNRHRNQRMVRASAPQQEAMTMAGVRMPIRRGGNFARFGRYHGDAGPESDAFAATAWPYLRTQGKFKLISRYWTTKLSEEILWENTQAALAFAAPEVAAEPASGPANFPSPCLFGSPFTCLGITQNYLSKLHCEPGEHPFSFITWQDLLCPGSTLEVSYFWLTAGLAFLPQPGSALFIDVRLVTHRSEKCVVHNSQRSEEGRYGCALFIKPPVLRSNARLWADFDAGLQKRRGETAQ